MKYDFVAIGDITTDAFIKLTDAEELLNHGTRELCVRFADKVPFDEVIECVAVGNSANAAVAARKIGLSAALITRIGDDKNGEDCYHALQERGVSAEYIGIEQGMHTNYHYVLWFGAERTILVKQNEFHYSLPEFAEPPRYIYLTSLGKSAEAFHHEVAAYCKAHPETKLAYQPGTFQLKLGYEGLRDVFEASEYFFCNVEEAQTLLKTQDRDVKKLMEGIRALGPKIVIVTDGPAGSNILDEEGAWHIPMYPDPAPPISRTGAGDATSATTIAYIGKGLKPREALMRGAINSASVVQGVGAQTKLLTDAQIELWYEHRPDDFSPVAL